MSPRTEGQKAAQREIVDSLQTALDARRQRIIVSESSVNWVKCTGVILVALLTLIAIAFVHSGNRLTAALAMGIFAAAVAVSLRQGDNRLTTPEGARRRPGLVVLENVRRA
jgi:hypothetical protein